MAQVHFRQPSQGDTPALKRIWAESFGDPVSYIDSFFSRFFTPENCVAAFSDGAAVSAMYALRGLSLDIPGRSAMSCAYLYALCTNPRYRSLGLGREVTRRLCAMMYESGERIVCTMPASAGLYRWYESALGAKAAFCVRGAEFMLRGSVRTVPDTAPISAEEYAALREGFLADTPHIRFPIELIRWQQETAAYSGGGLFSVSGGAAAVEKRGDRLCIKELLVPAGKEAAAARSLLCELGVKSAIVSMPPAKAEDGGRLTYTAALLPGPKEGISLPPGCYWGLLFD